VAQGIEAKRLAILPWSAKPPLSQSAIRRPVSSNHITVCDPHAEIEGCYCGRRWLCGRGRRGAGYLCPQVRAAGAPQCSKAILPPIFYWRRGCVCRAGGDSHQLLAQSTAQGQARRKTLSDVMSHPGIA